MADAFLIFDRGEVYDNSDREPRLVLRVSSGEVVDAPRPLPDWVRKAMAGSPLSAQLD